jgi:hypothetical protein
MREINLQSIGNLLWTPGRSPAPVLTPTPATPNPVDVRTLDDRTVWAGNMAGKTFLDIVLQSLILRQFGEFRSLGTVLRVPLRGRSPIRQFTVSR